MLYNLLSVMSFAKRIIKLCLQYCANHPVLAVIAALLTVAMLGLIIAIPCVASQRKKKRLAFEAEQSKLKAEQAKAKAQASQSAEVVQAQPTPAIEAQPPQATESAPTPAPEVTEPVSAPIIEKTETQPAEVQAAEATPIAKTQPAATTEATQESVQPVPAPTELEKTAENVEAESVENPVEPETGNGEVKQKKYTGIWVVFHMVTGSDDGVNKDEDLFFFELHASNGEKLLSSEEYTSYAGAVRGIDTHKKNILANNFRLTLSKKGHYIFKLLNGKNTLLCTGENYPNKARCEKAIESTKRFAETAILDENTRELFIKLPPEEETTPTALPEGCVGKWVISSNTSAEGETVFFFDLYANNGEKLLSSEEYSSYIGAMNGLETHKKNIAADNFRIVLTKRGDYIYKLLNGNGQLLCLGEHYKTRKRCQNAVESVKRFAFGSPVLTSEKIKQS